MLLFLIQSTTLSLKGWFCIPQVLLLRPFSVKREMIQKTIKNPRTWSSQPHYVGNTLVLHASHSFCHGLGGLGHQFGWVKAFSTGQELENYSATINNSTLLAARLQLQEFVTVTFKDLESQYFRDVWKAISSSEHPCHQCFHFCIQFWWSDSWAIDVWLPANHHQKHAATVSIHRLRMANNTMKQPLDSIDSIDSLRFGNWVLLATAQTTSTHEFLGRRTAHAASGNPGLQRQCKRTEAQNSKNCVNFFGIVSVSCNALCHVHPCAMLKAWSFMQP